MTVSEAALNERRAWPGSGSTPDTGTTEPAHYALINLTYLSLLATVVALARHRARRGEVAIPGRELPVLGLATFALAHVLAKEKVSTWIREPFVEETGDHRPVRAEGSGLRHAVGELLTCTRCIGGWCALGLVGLRIASPRAGKTVSAVLATAGANNVLQALFTLLTERANAAAARSSKK